MGSRRETYDQRKSRRAAHLKQHVGKPCPYCSRLMVYLTVDGGKHSPTRDHVHTAYSKGGLLTDDNKLVVCAHCNSCKGSRSLGEWLDHLVATGDDRAKHVRIVVEDLT